MFSLLRLNFLLQRCSSQSLKRSVESLFLAEIALKGLSGTPVRCYAAPPKKGSTLKEDKGFVDEDAEKLCSHVCINYFVEAKEPGPKILPDDQYPSWLFELDLRDARPLEDLDPEIDGWKYWRAWRKREREQKLRHQKLEAKFLHLQNSPSMRKSQGLSYRPALVHKSGVLKHA